jgi:prepilin-type N-terminal cleavage/methylation domain-containing protein
MFHSKSAFTMVELIFVIAILGILAAVAIPKLAIARNDARASVIATRLSNCIQLSGKGYLMDDAFDINESDCVEVVMVRSCFILIPDDANGNFTVKNVVNATNECKSGQDIALKNKLSSLTGVIHKF